MGGDTTNLSPLVHTLRGWSTGAKEAAVKQQTPADATALTRCTCPGQRPQHRQAVPDQWARREVGVVRVGGGERVPILGTGDQQVPGGQLARNDPRTVQVRRHCVVHTVIVTACRLSKEKGQGADEARMPTQKVNRAPVQCLAPLACVRQGAKVAAPNTVLQALPATCMNKLDKRRGFGDSCTPLRAPPLTGRISGAMYNVAPTPTVWRAAASAGTNLDSPRSASSYVGRHPTRSRTTTLSSLRSLQGPKRQS
jgi:hypothetical protein